MVPTIISTIPNDISLLVYRELHRSHIGQCLQEMFGMLEWRDDVSWYKLRNGKSDLTFNFRNSARYAAIYRLVNRLSRSNIWYMTLEETRRVIPPRYWYSSGLNSALGYK